MEYTINRLGKMAGVSTRTLRYYDQIGLLKPQKKNKSGYRIYGREQIEGLQQILFYRELGIQLNKIKEIITSPSFKRLDALLAHLDALKSRRRGLDALIKNVEKSISATKGEITMQDEEKFEGFKKSLISENEEKYGTEARAKYGNDAVDRSNAKIMGMPKKKYSEMEKTTEEFNMALMAAFEQGDPAGELAHKACELHKKWLMFFWDSYSPEAHRGLARMYVDDQRFAANYEKIAPGCAVFLRDAILIYCK